MNMHDQHKYQIHLTQTEYRVFKQAVDGSWLLVDEFESLSGLMSYIDKLLCYLNFVNAELTIHTERR